MATHRDNDWRMEKAVKIGKAIKKKQMNTFSANFKTISVAQGRAHQGPLEPNQGLLGPITAPLGPLGPFKGSLGPQEGRWGPTYCRNKLTFPSFSFFFLFISSSYLYFSFFFPLFFLLPPFFSGIFLRFCILQTFGPHYSVQRRKFAPKKQTKSFRFFSQAKISFELLEK